MQSTSILRRFPSLGLFVLAPLAAACSGNTSNSQSTPPVAYSDFATHFAQSYCSSIQSCCTQSGYATTTCQSSLQAYLNAAFATIAADPKVTYDAAAGARFIDAYRAVNTACSDPSAVEAMGVDWRDVFKGTVALGGACGTSQDCIQAEGTYVSCTTGVCTLESSPFSGPHATLGQACAGTCSTYGSAASCGGGAASATATAYCWTNEGLYCSSSNTCVAVPTVGQACGSSNYCEPAAHCQSGTCVADTTTGPCSNDDGCVSTSYCSTGLNVAGVCTPKKANGAACNSDSECAGGQCEQDICRNWTIATAASCAGLLDD